MGFSPLITKRKKCPHKHWKVCSHEAANCQRLWLSVKEPVNELLLNQSLPLQYQTLIRKEAAEILNLKSYN